MNSVYPFKVKTISGREGDLTRFRGQVLLIVNVASQCGFTSQYENLQKLYERYREKGFRILGFPCNDFMQQEPGDEQAVLEFCQKNYQVDFDLFSKVKILKPEPHPLYQALQEEKILPGPVQSLKSAVFKVFKIFWSLGKNGRILKPHEVQWNFHKFLIDKSGRPVSHFSSEADPLDPVLTHRIEEELEA